jgi:hypothetical protein
VSRLNKAATLYDEDTREPIQQAEHYSSVTVPGQVSWVDTSKMEPTKGGIIQNAQGYVLFRKVDLDALSFMIQINDRITKMGHVDADVYVERIEWLGHYPDQIGPSLVKAFFSDRLPAKQPGA